MLRQSLKQASKKRKFVNKARKFSSAILDTRKEILNHSSLDRFLFHHQNKINENLIIEVPLRNIEVLEEPLDFYSAMHVSIPLYSFKPNFFKSGITGSYDRVCTSALYWGVNQMEKNLIMKLFRKLERTDDLRVRMIMDFHRGKRENINSPIRELSSYEYFHNLAMANVNADIQVGLLNCCRTDLGSIQRVLYNTSGQFKEALGTHHAKFAVFDDNVILTGANFESQYFLDRKDRYWIINDCKELADYLEDYTLNLLGACEKIGWDGENYGVTDYGGKGKKSASNVGEGRTLI